MPDSHPWLEPHRGGKSVTELQILHGVLNDLKFAGWALFYFRSGAYAESKGGDYLPASGRDARRQSDLKERIRKSCFPAVQDFSDPAALAERLEADLWGVLDETFPAAEVPDAFAREEMRQEGCAAPRRGMYLGGEAYLKALDEALALRRQWILIGGQSGGGKRVTRTSSCMCSTSAPRPMRLTLSRWCVGWSRRSAGRLAGRRRFREIRRSCWRRCHCSWPIRVPGQE